jgi:hypothetical protein
MSAHPRFPSSLADLPKGLPPAQLNLNAVTGGDDGNAVPDRMAFLGGLWCLETDSVGSNRFRKLAADGICLIRRLLPPIPSSSGNALGFPRLGPVERRRPAGAFGQPPLGPVLAVALTAAGNHLSPRHIEGSDGGNAEGRALGIGQPQQLAKCRGAERAGVGCNPVDDRLYIVPRQPRTPFRSPDVDVSVSVPAQEPQVMHGDLEILAPSIIVGQGSAVAPSVNLFQFTKTAVITRQRQNATLALLPRLSCIMAYKFISSGGFDLYRVNRCGVCGEHLESAFGAAAPLV